MSGPIVWAISITLSIHKEIMKCIYCKKEIVFDKEDGFWDSMEKGNYYIPYCNNIEYESLLPPEDIVFHKPNYLLEYYECIASIAEKK
jgi:hypothetical protein